MAIRLPTNKQAAADTALSDIRETSQRCRALLDVITGDGFSYFSTLDGELQEAYLHQAFMLTAEVNDLAAAAKRKREAQHEDFNSSADFR